MILIDNSNHELDRLRNKHPLAVRQAEGWCIDTDGIVAGKYPPWTVCFANNEEARAYVQQRADEGSQMHAEVLAAYVEARLRR